MRLPLSLSLRPALLTLGVLGLTARLHAAEPAAPAQQIAIAVVFDTSGSMKQSVARKGGGREPKIEAARRAFHGVIDRLDTFAKTPNAKPLAVGIYAFRRTDAVVAHPLTRFSPTPLRRWVDSVEPIDSTPLGNALFIAGRDLLAADAASRHLLVLTDGENTTGRTPEAALQQIMAAAEKKQVSLFTHIIAFDIKPSVFAALKKQGATLIGAADGEQLRAQFDFILDEKILVEAPR